MNPADPKWLEILKARGWQTAALATASGLILVLVKCKIIPTTDSPLWITLPFISLVIFATLFIAAVGDEIAKIIKPVDKINQWYLKRREVKAVREFIPYMTDKDREIIGYLLYHNQKMFQADQDGGYAAPLISKGIIRPSGRAGQVVSTSWMPFEVPDHIWSVLKKNQEVFPYKPPPANEIEKYPWAIPWMVR